MVSIGLQRHVILGISSEKVAGETEAWYPDQRQHLRFNSKYKSSETQRLHWFLGPLFFIPRAGQTFLSLCNSLIVVIIDVAILSEVGLLSRLGVTWILAGASPTSVRPALQSAAHIRKFVLWVGPTSRPHADARTYDLHHRPFRPFRQDSQSQKPSRKHGCSSDGSVLRQEA